MLLTINGKVNRIDGSGIAVVGESLESLTIPNGVSEALKKVIKAKLEAASAPKLIEARNSCPNFNDSLWNWHTTMTGIYNVGNQTYFHNGQENQPLANPERIRKAVSEGLVNYGAKLRKTESAAFREGTLAPTIPYEEFLARTEKEEIQEPYIVVADNTMLAELENGFLNTNGKWSKDPRAIIASGSRARAVEYEATLRRKGRKQAYLSIDKQTGLPDRGRLGFVGDYSLFVSSGFNGIINLNYYGRFFGVVPEALRAKNFGTEIPLEDRVEVLGDGKIRFQGNVYTSTE